MLNFDEEYGKGNTSTAPTTQVVSQLIIQQSLSSSIVGNIIYGTSGVNDVLVGSSGIDTVDYSNDVAAVTVNIQSGSATDGGGGIDTLTAIENIRGSNYNDTLVGNHALDNVIWGNDGNDNIQGRNGADTLYGENGNDTIRGGNGDDIIYGGDGNDFLYGNAGDDEIWGDDGVDAIWGHGGADTFGYLNTCHPDVDNIKDFDISEGDALDISDLVDQYDPLTDDISDFIAITEVGQNSIVSVDDDGTTNGAAFTDIVQLSGVTGLSDVQTLIDNGNIIIT